MQISRDLMRFHLHDAIVRRITQEQASGMLVVELKLVEAPDWGQDVIHNQVGQLVFYDVAPEQADFGGDNRWGRMLHIDYKPELDGQHGEGLLALMDVYRWDKVSWASDEVRPVRIGVLMLEFAARYFEWVPDETFN